MGSLTVDNGGNPHGGVILHSFPDLHHVSACRIHNLHALLLQRIHERSRNTERGNNHHIVWSNPVIGGIQLLPGKFSNAHFLQLPVHFRIVNNVPNQKNPPVRKHSACRVCYINSTAHAVAEPELPGEKKSVWPRLYTLPAERMWKSIHSGNAAGFPFPPAPLLRPVSHSLWLCGLSPDSCSQLPHFPSFVKTITACQPELFTVCTDPCSWPWPP